MILMALSDATTTMLWQLMVVLMMVVFWVVSAIGWQRKKARDAASGARAEAPQSPDAV